MRIFSISIRSSSFWLHSNRNLGPLFVSNGNLTTAAVTVEKFKATKASKRKSHSNTTKIAMETVGKQTQPKELISFLPFFNMLEIQDTNWPSSNTINTAWKTWNKIYHPDKNQMPDHQQQVRVNVVPFNISSSNIF